MSVSAVAGPTSPTSRRAVAFVVAHEQAALDLGAHLADLVNEPDRFAREFRSGLEPLADPEYGAGQARVAPGLGPIHGVRSPLLAGVARGFRDAARGISTTPILFVVDRLFREPECEARWFAFGLLERTLPEDPERSWQLLRRGARETADWITVDTLARAYAKGILAEAYRWSEVEQLIYSPSRWERRLVGSTIATLPFVDRRAGRRPDVAATGLQILAQVIGDSEPDVRKALSWAYRSLLVVDRPLVSDALAAETDRAVADDDGHRAWVIRDVLVKLDPPFAARLRERLAGIRSRGGAPSTSSAAQTVAAFGALPDPHAHPEPPLAADEPGRRRP